MSARMGLNEIHEVLLELLEDLLLPQILDGILACRTAKTETQVLVLDQLQHCRMECDRVLRCNR